MLAPKLLGLVVLSSVGLACGEPTPAKAPEATKTTEAAPVPVDSAPAPNAGQPQTKSDVPPLQGSFVSIVRAPSSGKEDKIGEHDGDFKPDGIKDLVFDVEFDGQAAAFIVASVDAEGTPTGIFDADSLAGKEIFPGEILHSRDPADVNAGIVIYENGKLLNKPNGGIDVFPAGVHKLTFRISSKKAGKLAVRAFAMLADRSVITGPIIPAAK